MEPNILQQCHGSSRVRFKEGGTDVITSVKAEVRNVSDASDPYEPVVTTVAFAAPTSIAYHSRIMETRGDLLAENVKK